MSRIPPRQRPHYPPWERLAILCLRSAAGWSAAETARRFLLAAPTTAEWSSRLDEHGPGALVRTPSPVNRFPDLVRHLVARLKVSIPSMGRRRIASVLARAGLHLAPTTVRRMLRSSSERPPPKPAGPQRPVETTEPRAVRARYPHHVWHVDLTVVPTGLGFWVPWSPFTVLLRWPFCYWVGAVLDQASRAGLATLVAEKQPSAHEVCAMLDRAVASAGRAPRHIVTDHGVQFGKDYRAWCERVGARPRWGALGKSGSIAVIERFFRSLKVEWLRRILVPLTPGEMTRELGLYVSWYNEHRPHSALRGATPRERLDAIDPACDQPGVETRPRVPLARRGRHRCRDKRLRGSLELVVRPFEGRAALPVVVLKQAA